jgi:hypothetical protein
VRHLGVQVDDTPFVFWGKSILDHCESGALDVPQSPRARLRLHSAACRPFRVDPLKPTQLSARQAGLPITTKQRGLVLPVAIRGLDAREQKENNLAWMIAIAWPSTLLSRHRLPSLHPERVVSSGAARCKTWT